MFLSRTLSLAAVGLLAMILLATLSCRDAAMPASTAPRPLKVVATFSILGDMAANVGGDRIALTTLVGPDGDSHAYEPTAQDARAVAEADVVLINGLGFEGWIGRLIEAAGHRRPVVVASRGVIPLQAAGGPRAVPDPHAWQRLDNARLYVANIARAFTVNDPDGASHYAANARQYLGRIDHLQQQLAPRLHALPADRRTLITPHAAFAYLGEDYGLHFLSPRGLSSQADPSARDLAGLIDQARSARVSALFQDSNSDPRLLQRIAAETDARLGGTLYADALSGPDGPAPTYLALMRHNADTLLDALAPRIQPETDNTP